MGIRTLDEMGMPILDVHAPLEECIKAVKHMALKNIKAANKLDPKILAVHS